MKTRMLPVAILAGGLATRLRPLTDTVPKALVDIDGEPFVAHQLRLLRNLGGIERVVICAGYKGEMIREFVGEGSRLGLEVLFSFDGDRLLGTGGAIRKALPLLGDAFFVLYGDSYLPCDYRAAQTAFEASGKEALMTVFLNNGQWDTSNVEFSNGRILAYGKKNLTPRMHYIDYGLGIFRASAFDTVPEGEPSDMAVLYSRLAHNGQLAAFETTERFYEIGSPAGLEELRLLIRSVQGQFRKGD